MTSINDVRLVGKLVKDPEFLETAARKKFAKLTVETENYIRVNGERKRFAHVHTVVCFNQFSLPVLEGHARSGTRVKVLGELVYDRSGKAEVRVRQYSGEVGLMDPEDSSTAPAGAVSPSPAVPKTNSKPSGGLGRLPNSRQAEDISAPRESFKSDADLDDEIPF